MLEVKELYLILGMFLATFSTRYILFASAGRLQFNPWVNAALGFVPPVVLAAIVGTAVLMPEGTLWLSIHNTYLIAAIVALLVALWRKNLLLTIVVGMATLMLLRVFGS